MAIDYTTLFTQLGKLVKWSNRWLTLQNDTDTGAILYAADEIQDQYDARRDLVSGIQARMQGFSSTVAGWVVILVGYATATLQDLRQELNAPSSNLSDIFPLLVADMAANSQTVNANAISTPTVTAGGSNVGTGQLLACKRNTAGVDDERIISETIRFACIADRFNGASVGAESFTMTGFPANVASSYLPRGNGTGPGIQVGDESSSNLLSNGDFETWSVANTPDNWSTVGVIGTNILEESSALHSATSAGALQLKSDATATTITVSQTIASLVSPNSLYAIGAWVRKSGAFGAGVTNLQIAVKGTGFTTVNLFNADPTTLATSYAFKKGGSDGFFVTPAVIPSDLRVEITWTSANLASAGAMILVDDMALLVPVKMGNVSYALFRGGVDFVVGDSFSVATVSDYGGVFQTFFGRFFGVQLPSDAGGTETLSDTLAT